MIQDLFDNAATFKKPIYNQDSAKGTQVQQYETVASGVDCQANPLSSHEMYEMEVKAMVREWEILILEPEWDLSVVQQLILRDGEEMTIKSFEKFDSVSEAIPTYFAIHAEQYINL